MANPNVSQVGYDLKVLSGVIAPAERAAGDTDGAGVDRLGFNSALLVVDVGALTGTPTTTSVIAKVQHSADNVTFADFTGGAADAITAASTSKRKAIDLAGANRYVRVRLVCAFTGGATPKAFSAARLILGGAVNKPVTDA